MELTHIFSEILWWIIVAIFILYYPIKIFIEHKEEKKFIAHMENLREQIQDQYGWDIRYYSCTRFSSKEEFINKYEIQIVAFREPVFPKGLYFKNFIYMDKNVLLKYPNQLLLDLGDLKYELQNKKNKSPSNEGVSRSKNTQERGKHKPMVEIPYIDIKATTSEINRVLTDVVDRWPAKMEYSIEPVTLRKNRNSGRRIKFKNEHDDLKFDVVTKYDPNTDTIIFCNLKIASMKKKFYLADMGVQYQPGASEDTTLLAVTCLIKLAEEFNGTIACLASDDVMTIIKNGKKVEAEGIGLIDTNGEVYVPSNFDKPISVKDEDDESSFQINKPINVWLDENPKVKEKMMTYNTMPERMDFVGKVLIQLKLRDTIDTDEFMDIFRQAGVIGFSDSSVSNIYKLLI